VGVTVRVRDGVGTLPASQIIDIWKRSARHVDTGAEGPSGADARREPPAFTISSGGGRVRQPTAIDAGMIDARAIHAARASSSDPTGL
jgi:hypothetical protein